MGSCIICGTDVDGVVCRSHEEDVVFIFEGSRPDQLTPGRYYRGTVDGFADFGVFVDVGDTVTGLLHTSELDRRLESLEWQPGDEVFVQVKNVRDNGNVDLGWSIRQHESEFRAKAFDAPDGEYLPDDDADEESTTDSDSTADAETEIPPSESESAPTPAAQTVEQDQPPQSTQSDTPSAEPADGGAVVETKLQRSEIGDLADEIGDPVRLEGRITEARQTSGPTVFELQDETGTVDCAAFESAGERAYPEIEAGDIVQLQGIVEERRGSIQVETESLTALDGDERAEVENRLQSALDARARPDDVTLLGGHDGIGSIREQIVEAATAIRRAVFASRPVVVRHSATVDGYVAGVAVERAVLPLIRDEHDEEDAVYHYFDRRPLDGRVYEMDDAMRDTTAMLEARDRHDEPIPLFVFVNAASTEESRDSLDLLSLYGADRVVIDGDYPDDSMTDAADVLVSPFLGPADSEVAETVSTSAVTVNVAAHVTQDVREELKHLPAISYWHSAPSTFSELAREADHSEAEIQKLREAVALEAFYQAYEDKREILTDLLFEGHELVGPASEQFRERVEEEVRTATPHIDHRSSNGATLGVLDLTAFTHYYDFPPADVLLAELAAAEGLDAIIGVEEDGLTVWSQTAVDMRTVGERVALLVPDGGVETRGGRDGTLAFLAGAKSAVVDATVEAVADEV